MQFRSARLDPETLGYLQRVETAGGEGYPGVFVKRRSDTTGDPNPRAGSIPLILLGLVGLGIAAYLARPSGLDGGNLTRIARWQTGLAAGGVLFLLLGLIRICRAVPKPPLGSFVFADGLHLWEVDRHTSSALPLDQVLDLDCYHTTLGSMGLYLGSKIVLSTRSGSRDVLVQGRDSAEQLARFLYAQVVVRRNRAEEGEIASPETVGVIAHRIAFGEGALTAPVFVALREPTEISPPPTPGRVRRRLVPVAAAAIVGVAGWFAFPAADAAILENHLYARIPTTDTGRFEEMDHYLARLPDGKRATEVRDLRDDRRYALAVRESDGKRSPAALRDYLADRGNARHRSDAQTRINVYYDQAIADLKKRAVGPNTDPKLVEAFIAMLEGLKTAERPVVTVGFNATQDSAPVTEGQKLREKYVYDLRVKEKAELRRIADNKGTAILPLGGTFDPAQTATRQKVILRRLQAAITRGIRSDILTLEAAQPGEPAMLEVGYHIFAPGRLYLYTETITRTGYGGSGLGSTEKVKGLLRGYEVDWTITVRPPGTKPAFECKLGSSPATSLNYDSKSGDPDWSPYAVILYSGFYDMSSRLIRNFGLDPGPDRTRISFAQATGDED